MNSEASKFVLATAKITDWAVILVVFNSLKSPLPNHIPRLRKVHLRDIKSITIHIIDHEIYGFNTKIGSFYCFIHAKNG